MGSRLIQILVLGAFGVLWAQDGWHSRFRLNYVAYSEYEGPQHGQSDIQVIQGYSKVSPKAIYSARTIGDAPVSFEDMNTSELHVEGYGRGIEFQYSFSNLTYWDGIRYWLPNVYMEAYGVGFLTSFKMERVASQAEQFSPAYSAWNFTLDLGVALYLSIWEGQLGFGRVLKSDPLGFNLNLDYHQNDLSGNFIYLRQYLNIPLVYGVNLNAGIALQKYFDPILETTDLQEKASFDMKEDSWFNMYISFGLTYTWGL